MSKLTPVLSAHWDEKDSFTIEGYWLFLPGIGALPGKLQFMRNFTVNITKMYCAPAKNIPFYPISPILRKSIGKRPIPGRSPIIMRMLRGLLQVLTIAGVPWNDLKGSMSKIVITKN